MVKTKPKVKMGNNGREFVHRLVETKPKSEVGEINREVVYILVKCEAKSEVRDGRGEEFDWRAKIM